MKYCRQCFYNDLKPDIWFDDTGLCAACINFAARGKIDWKAREKEFADLASTLRGSQGYHVIIPVSGGKDSHAQVIRGLEFGLNILAVNVRTDDLTPLGRRNLDNICKLGVDLIEVAVNPLARGRIARYGLETVGDISWAEHATIFTVPFKEALNRGITHIVWGENSQNEYGGPKKDAGTKKLTTDWLQEFGGLNGLRVQDLLDGGVVSKHNLIPYRVFPVESGISSLFMGYYFPWSGLDNARLAKRHGFEWNPTPVDGSGCEYENLDNYQTGLHDYFKYIKFGFGRATDIVNNNIRRGICDRELGREYVITWDGKYGDKLSYLGKSGEDVVKEIGMTKEQLWDCVEKFTNRELFDYVGKGLVKPKFLAAFQKA